MFVSSTVFVLSGRGLCDGPIPRPEESYRLWCVSECDQVKINNLDICCEQVEEGRTTKRNEFLYFLIVLLEHWDVRANAGFLCDTAAVSMIRKRGHRISAAATEVDL
jgi:hypothetical protein